MSGRGGGMSAPTGMSAPRGVSTPRGVWPQGGGSLVPGGGVCSQGGVRSGGIPACTEAGSPCGQIDRCKNITFATSLRTVIIMPPAIQHNILYFLTEGLLGYVGCVFNGLLHHIICSKQHWLTIVIAITSS